MAAACDISISFAAAGNCLAFLGDGWAQSEERFTWSIGAESQLILPRLEDAGEYVLTLDVVPFVHSPDLPNQRLIVSINGTVVGSNTLGRPSLLGYRLPTALILGRDRNVVTLQHPDASCPKDFLDTADDRRLALAFLEARLCRNTGLVPSAECLPAGLMLQSFHERSFGAGNADLQQWALARTGLTIPQIALRFESLGENCEFGLFQRRCDVEPLGLLRFSSTFMRNLIRGIDERFDGIGEPGDIEVRLEGAPRKEHMIHEKKFGLVYHTFVYEGQRSLWLIREQEAARLKFLRRKFLEDIAATDKILVYKFGLGMSQEEILPLHMALARHAAATLLWVVPEDRSRPAGTVEVLSPGLLRGYIDRFAPEDNAHDFSFDGWLQICVNACVLVGLHRAPHSATIADVRRDNQQHVPMKDV